MLEVVGCFPDNELEVIVGLGFRFRCWWWGVVFQIMSLSGSYKYIYLGFSLKDDDEGVVGDEDVDGDTSGRPLA